jgi:iron complex transport system substrate-binding protein
MTFSAPYAKAIEERNSGTAFNRDGATAQRIVSMGPNITEIVFALGCGNRLVAVTDFCMYPPEVAGLPKVGGYLNPNLEKLTTLRPDLVLIRGKIEKVDRFCRSRGIPVVRVHMDSLKTIYSGIQHLGRALGVVEKADVLCNTIREALDTVRAKSAAIPATKVFISLGRAMGSMANLYTVGGNSFLSQLVEIGGGINIFADVDQPYPEASKESLIKRSPEVILEMRPGENMTQKKRNQIIAEWGVFDGVPAVTNGRIYVLTQDFLLIPGPRIVETAHTISQTLHGDY